LVTAPNNDCLVSSARIDLSGGPVLIDAPSIPDRYFSIVFMDCFTDNFAFIGTRATAGRGGRILLAPPGWRGFSAEANHRIMAPSLDVWMLARILVEGPDDVANVNGLQDQLAISRLDPTAAGVARSVAPGDGKDPSNFLAVVNAMLARATRPDRRVRRRARFAHLGMKPGDVGAFEKLAPAIQAAWAPAILDGLERLKLAAGRNERKHNGWAYSNQAIGRFGDDDFGRAQIALSGLAALPSDEVIYATTRADALGGALNGARNYRLKIPPGGAPVDGFWSITLYQIEPDGRMFFAQNPIGRHSIGDRTRGLALNEDGSLNIQIGPDLPIGQWRANWLPSPPGPIQLTFRGYLPRPALSQHRWRLGPVLLAE